MQTQIENDKLNGDMKYRNERERDERATEKGERFGLKAAAAKKLYVGKTVRLLYLINNLILFAYLK